MKFLLVTLWFTFNLGHLAISQSDYDFWALNPLDIQFRKKTIYRYTLKDLAPYSYPNSVTANSKKELDKILLELTNKLKLAPDSTHFFGIEDYDSNGRLLRYRGMDWNIDAFTNIEREYSYDHFNRVIAEYEFDKNGNPKRRFSYEFDSLNFRVCIKKDGKVHSTYYYNQHKYLDSVIECNVLNCKSVIKCKYDPVSNTITYFNIPAETIDFITKFDKDRQPVEFIFYTDSNTIDSRYVRSYCQENALLKEEEFEPSGKLRKTTNYVYNNLNKLTSIYTVDSMGKYKSSRLYEYKGNYVQFELMFDRHGLLKTIFVYDYE